MKGKVDAEGENRGLFMEVAVWSRRSNSPPWINPPGCLPYAGLFSVRASGKWKLLPLTYCLSNSGTCPLVQLGSSEIICYWGWAVGNEGTSPLPGKGFLKRLNFLRHCTVAFAANLGLAGLTTSLFFSSSSSSFFLFYSSCFDLLQSTH